MLLLQLILVNMKHKYQQRIVIPCYDTDVSQLLKPSSFMDLAQEAANIHAKILGFGYDRLIETRTAWVLSRMHIEFLRHPRWNEEVELSTWHKGPERLFYLRDFLMISAGGEPLVRATTSWLVLNIGTRRLVRSSGISTEDTCQENAIEKPCDKVQMPSDVDKELVAEHVVSYSDVDLNGHTNNAMYLVWSMDVVDYAVTSSVPLKELKINFNKETKPGEKVSLYRAVKEIDVLDDTVECGGRKEITVYVEGEVDGHSAFCVELKF